MVANENENENEILPWCGIYMVINLDNGKHTTLVRLRDHLTKDGEKKSEMLPKL
jgi:hypothetical protein